MRFRESDQTCRSQDQDVWIGLGTQDDSVCNCDSSTDEECKACRDKFTWLQGPVAASNYTNWRSEEPGNNDFCVRIAESDSTWAGSPCDNAMKAVCEIGTHVVLGFMYRFQQISNYFVVEKKAHLPVVIS